MLNVLVANQDKAVGDNWRERLEKAGYKVSKECSDLSTLVFILTQEKIHIIICSLNMIGKNADIVIRSIQDFFPRVKIVFIGKPLVSSLPGVLGKYQNIIIRKEFSVEFGDSFKPQQNVLGTGSPTEDLSLLLGEHFLTDEDAARMLGRAMPKGHPGYVVISIIADSELKRIYSVVSRAIFERKQGYAVRMPDEVCVILENSPSEDTCFGFADILYTELLTKTDAMFSIGISRERSRASELCVCRKEARRAALAWHLYGKNSIIHINYLGGNEIEYLYPRHKEKRLIELTVDGDCEGAVHMLEDIFEVFRVHESLSIELVKKFSLGIIVGLNIAAASKAKSFEQVQLETKPFKRLTVTDNMEDVFSVLRDMVYEFAKEMDAIADLQRDALFVRLSDLKSKRDSLTVSDIVRTFRATICFINRSVAQNTGGNIFDFIQSK